MKNTLFLSMSLSALGLLAQENLTYQTPPQSILQLADYQRPASVSMDYKKEWMLYIQYPTYKSLEDLGQDEMRLGGLRINPTTRIASTTTYATNLQLGKVGELQAMPIQGLPENPKLAYISWSPDEKFIAFVHNTGKGIELWVVNVATQTATKLSEDNLNGAMGSPFTWYADSKALLVRKNVPGTLQDRSKDLPTGPVVSTSEGKASQNRTYQDLLKNPTDEHNFVVLCTSSLHRISLEGEEKQVLPPNLYAGESFSPDGKYLLIEHLETPFSYIVPYYRFPMVATVYRNATYQKVKEVNRTPLIEIMPKGFMATSTHRRSMGWRPDQPATLSFAQALDGGDPANQVPFRDALYTWEAPFSAEPKLMAKVPQRYGGVIWGNNEHAFLVDQWYDTRSMRTYHFAPGKPGKDLQLVWDRNYQDRYNDPGNFETERNQYGKRVLAIRNGVAFLRGDGYTPEGQFPFLDKLDLKTFKTTRWYRSEYTDRVERLVSVEDFETGKLLVNIQSATDYPNYYFRNLSTGALTPVTKFENPFASLGQVKKEVISYTRKDGLELSGTLYLPAGYDPSKDGKLPLLIWAYPEEYKDRSSASQNTQNPNEFTYPYYGSFVYWVTRGYAVLDDASFPIVGEGSAEPNDSFLDQLVANAEAAIDAVANRGIADREKVAIGGHSYGAFMTANLLTHSNLFACGIARSGAYNRTLTPFGFQSEQRNYWDVPQVYNGMSPFQNASKMKTPLLLVHGEADNNPGTFTLQTERYFQALKGLGAPVRMVILPKESHGYAAKENILHLLWEQDQFLEKHLK